MRKLVIATGNRNKFKELRESLEGLGWELVPAFDFPGAPDVVEDGNTLEENAAKKARTLCGFTGLPALADDTGLFVKALDGRPGIYAARYAGEGCSYEDNVRKLLGEMRNAGKGERAALFRTVIALAEPEKPVRTVSGEVQGVITLEASGTGGFGYDPVFQPEGENRVFAQMSLEEKNRISHRGRAVREARKLLEGI
jgi:XTP/dITP diphosphohydrolase